MDYLSYRSTVVVLILLLLAGCAEIPVQKQNPIALPQKLVVLPVVTMMGELRMQGYRIHSNLKAKLEELGCDCNTIGKDQYQSFRRQALEQSGSIYDPAVGEFMPLKEDRYVESMISQLVTSGDYDGVVFVELVLRRAVFDDGRLIWDDTVQPLVVIGGELKNHRLLQQTRGLSINLHILDREGDLLYKQIAGISVPFELDLTVKPPHFRLRQLPFNNSQLNAALEMLMAGLTFANATQ